MHLAIIASLAFWPPLSLVPADPDEKPRHEAELVFPLHDQHNHAPGIVECPNGDLLVSWYRGSGERRPDDVAVFGARKKKGAITTPPSSRVATAPSTSPTATSSLAARA